VEKGRSVAFLAGPNPKKKKVNELGADAVPVDQKVIYEKLQAQLREPEAQHSQALAWIKQVNQEQKIPEGGFRIWRAKMNYWAPLLCSQKAAFSQRLNYTDQAKSASR